VKALAQISGVESMARVTSVLGVAVAAALALAAPAADAGVYIGLQQDANPIVPKVVNAPGLGIYALPFGNFELTVAVGIGDPVVPPPNPSSIGRQCDKQCG